ncbi:hypothetical protein [Pseudoalteromonas piscicida]
MNTEDCNQQSTIHKLFWILIPAMITAAFTAYCTVKVQQYHTAYEIKSRFLYEYGSADNVTNRLGDTNDTARFWAGLHVAQTQLTLIGNTKAATIISSFYKTVEFCNKSTFSYTTDSRFKI